MSAEAAQEPRAIIELDIFSGRPNPSWELGAAEAKALLHVLDEARQSGRGRNGCSVPGLGYRGLNLRIIMGPRISNWHVFEDCVEHDGESFEDVKRVVEAYIFRSMPAKLKSDLAAVLPQIIH